MAEKRAYNALVLAMSRKAKELAEYLVKEDAQGRIAKSKHDKLRSDIPELNRLGEEYAATLTGEDDVDVIVYDNQNKLLEDVQQALERAVEFVEEEDFKLGIMRTTQEVEQGCKSLESRFAHFKKKTDRFKTGEYELPKESYEVLISELESLAGQIDECVGSIGYLTLHNPDQKTVHGQLQDKVDSYKGIVLDQRLTLIGVLEKQYTGDEKKISVQSSLPKLSGLSAPPMLGQDQRGRMLGTLVPAVRGSYE